MPRGQMKKKTKVKVVIQQQRLAGSAGIESDKGNKSMSDPKPKKYHGTRDCLPVALQQCSLIPASKPKKNSTLAC
jgi:hypothetical protein